MLGLLCVLLFALLRRTIVLLVLEAPAQAFESEHAGQKVQVAFAVLGPDGAGCQFLADIEFEAHLRVIGEQLRDEVARILVLEDIAVAAQAQQGQGRLEAQPVARHAAVGAGKAAVGAQSVPSAPAAVGLQQLERDFLTEKAGKVQARRRAQGIDLEAEQLVDRLAAPHALGHQRFGQVRFLRRGQRDQPRMLRQARAEHALRSFCRCRAAHYGNVMVRLAVRGASLTISL